MNIIKTQTKKKILVALHFVDVMWSLPHHQQDRPGIEIRSKRTTTKL